MERLTEREAEVMNLLASGLNNQEISEQLCISTHTTKAHVSNIYKKLGVTNRVLAVKQIIANMLNNKNLKDDKFVD